jgi:hypothetical protein
VANTNLASTMVTMPAISCFVTANYQLVTSTNSLIAWYKLNGDAADSSGYGNTGSTVGSPDFVAGHEGAALLLNGSSQYVLSTTLGSFGANMLSGFTLTAWIKTTNTASQIIFGSYNDARTLGMSFSMAGNVVSFRLGGIYGSTSFSSITAATSLTDNNWHLLALSLSTSTTGDIYVDGQPQSATINHSTQDGYSNFTNPMGIGFRTGYNDGYFNGTLDDIRIYSEGLGSTNIAALYTPGSSSTGFPPLLLRVDK